MPSYSVLQKVVGQIEPVLANKQTKLMMIQKTDLSCVFLYRYVET